MDWTGCELVECVEGRCGGRPTLVNSRIWPEVLLESAADGMSAEAIHEEYPSVGVEQIHAILAFARRKQSAA